MSLKKRSFTLSGHRTSIALEPEFWAALEAKAAADGLSLTALMARLDSQRNNRPLASFARVFALQNAPRN